ncbi:hypothetical protein GCM10010435_81200 [Winogradskya consettensis]|uniref:Uncharacterized protein n=2 Tax=Winogradskya consettensis TaxID=113560 RepID=A0A919T5I8_9ACTN|nr:hypothetical protein Aco04nite_94640 [Actinoplanes consettensis]
MGVLAALDRPVRIGGLHPDRTGLARRPRHRQRRSRQPRKHRRLRYAFGNALTPDESDALYEQWVIPAPGKPLFEAATANFSTHSPAAVETGNNDRGPLLLVMGGRDHTVPEAVTKATFKQYRHSTAVTELLEFPDRGHSLTIDAGWRGVAEACLSWLGRKAE